MSTRVVTSVGPVVSIEPVQLVVAGDEVPGWVDGMELEPCPFCESTGKCEHLVAVIEVQGVEAPVHAQGGRAWGRRRIQETMAGLALVRLEGGAG